jgi:regulatory protein YycI of two-component signal transduction system YycFG
LKTEQILTDRKTMKQIMEFIEGAVREGLTKEEITSQVDLMLDETAGGRLEKSLKEVQKGNVKRYKDPQSLLKALRRSHHN